MLNGRKTSYMNICVFGIYFNMHTLVLTLLITTVYIAEASIFKSATRLSWSDALNGCVQNGEIANIKELPLLNADWSQLDFQRNERLWTGGFHRLTSFYWTKGGCYSNISESVSSSSIMHNSMEKCAFSCQDKKNIRHIALQGVVCFCLDKDPKKESANACKYPCSQTVNETCGLVNDNTFYVYTQLSLTDKQFLEGSKIRLLPNIVNQTAKHCMSLFPSKTTEEITYFLEPLYCKQVKKSICLTSTGYKIKGSFQDWESAKMSCENDTLAEITPSLWNSANKRIFDPGIQYWIGLRRFVREEYLSSAEEITTMPSSCLAVHKQNGHVQLTTLPCNDELKVACLRNKLGENDGNGKTVGLTSTKEVIQENNEATKTSILADNNTNTNIGPIIGAVVGVILLLILLGLILFFLCRRRSQKFQRTPSYREPHIEYSTKRKESEFEVLNQQSNNNKVSTPPQKPIRRTKSTNPSHKGIEYENIVLALEDPKALTKAVSLGIDASPRNSRQKRGAAVSDAVDEDSHYDSADTTVNRGNSGTEPNSRGSQKSGIYGMNGDSARQSTGNVYGFSVENENEYDVMNKDKTQTEDPNPDYDHMESITNSLAL